MRTIWLSERSTRACDVTDDGVEARSQAYSIIGSDCHRHFSAVQIRSPASEADLLYCCLFNIAIKWWRGRNCFTKSVDCSAGCGALLEEGCFLTSVLDSGFINLRTKRLHQQNRGGRRDCVQRCIFVRFLLHTKPTVATPALGCEPLDLISFQIQPKILPLGWYIKQGI